MVGIVIVSHSGKLAEGIAELAREMGGPDVVVETAGGLDLPGNPLGTDAQRVLRAIERAYSDQGVLVLMDLGSAVLSAEMALEMLPPGQRERVLLCEAPLIEGAVAASATSRLGASLDEVAAEARAGLQGKMGHLGAGGQVGPVVGEPASTGEGPSVRLEIRNPLGLHARPAARFVRTAGRFDAEVTVTNLTTGRGPARGRSLSGLATLGVLRGHEILVAARGPQAAEALGALEELAMDGFGEAEGVATVPAAPGPAAPPPAPPPGSGASLVGLPASPGTGFGEARHLRMAPPQIQSGPSGDPAAEWESLQQALERAGEEIRDTRSSVAVRAGEYSASIFDAHLLLLEDAALVESARTAILAGRSAGEAWNAAAEEVAAEYRRLDDEYLRARAGDVTSVAHRVLAHLSGTGNPPPFLEGPGIVVAADLSPADTANLDRELVSGIATAYGGPTSHSAILARSLGLPAVVGLGEGLLSLPEGTALLLDGDAGTVHVDPGPRLRADYEARSRIRAEADRRAEAVAREPAITRDGRRVRVLANVGSIGEVERAVAAGAEGVGLLRTEFLFLGRRSMPDEEEQYLAYRRIAEGLGGRPLVLRTLDVGADKPLPYLPQAPEANPFLGVRGIRLSLARPDMLKTQLRAALRVAEAYPVKVMFPMVFTLDEYRQARTLADGAREELAREGLPVPGRVEIGVMVEVPGVALMADRWAEKVDFFSIGTNDLAQYTAAADRGNERVAMLADALHPSVLRLIRLVVEAAEARSLPVEVCGELASDPIAVPILVGLGVRELSVAPPAIPRVKQIVRELDAALAGALAAAVLGSDSAAAAREMATRTARDGR